MSSCGQLCQARKVALAAASNGKATMIVEREIIASSDNRKTAKPRMLCAVFRRLLKCEAVATTLVASLSIVKSSAPDNDVTRLLACAD